MAEMSVVGSPHSGAGTLMSMNQCPKCGGMNGVVGTTIYSCYCPPINTIAGLTAERDEARVDGECDIRSAGATAQITTSGAPRIVELDSIWKASDGRLLRVVGIEPDQIAFRNVATNRLGYMRPKYFLDRDASRNWWLEPHSTPLFEHLPTISAVDPGAQPSGTPTPREAELDALVADLQARLAKVEKHNGELTAQVAQLQAEATDRPMCQCGYRLTHDSVARGISYWRCSHCGNPHWFKVAAHSTQESSR